MRFNRTAPALIAVRNTLLVIVVVGSVVGLTGCEGAGPKKANAMPSTDMQKYNDMMKAPKGNTGMNPAAAGAGMPGAPGGMPGAPGGMGGGPPHAGGGGAPHK